MLRLIIFAFILMAGQFVYMHYNETQNTPPPKSRQGCDDVVMYSASWCGACRKYRAKLHNEKVAFTEYVVDKDPKMDKIFREKVRKAGARGAYPTIEIAGEIMPTLYDVSYFKSQYNLCKR